MYLAQKSHSKKKLRTKDTPQICFFYPNNVFKLIDEDYFINGKINSIKSILTDKKKACKKPKHNTFLTVDMFFI